MTSLRLWATSGAAAVALAAAWALVAAVAGRLTADFWLLGVFTAGVLALLLGLSVVVGGRIPGLSARAGMARKFGASAESSGPADPESTEGSDRPGWWMVALGLDLLGIYVAGWVAIG